MTGDSRSKNGGASLTYPGSTLSACSKQDVDARHKAGHDETTMMIVGKRKCEATSPLKHSIPEFPTKVGGHHMPGSTDPARDSSLKDR